MTNRTKIITYFVSISLIVTFTFSSTVFAQCGFAPYNPKIGFGINGQVLTDSGSNSNDRGMDIAVQPDGKMVLAGSRQSSSDDWDFIVVRYNLDGSLDPTFGTAGMTTIDFSDRVDLAFGIALLPNGKMVVVGSTCPEDGEYVCDFAVARLNSNGTRDVLFGMMGRVTTDFAGSDDKAEKVAVQSDGKIVVAGKSLMSAGNTAAGVARYNTNGALDLNFSTDGKAVFGALDGGARDLAVQSDGRVVLIGESNSNFGAIRVNTSGAQDLTFGPRGRVSVDFAGHLDRAYTVALQPDGKIVMGGFAQTGNVGQPGGNFFDSALVRLDPDGMLDATFDGDGRVTGSLSSSNDGITDLIVQPSGKITFISNMDSPQTFALVDYHPNLANSCFYVWTGSNQNRKFLNAIAIQYSRIYTGGYVYPSTSGTSDILAAVFDMDLPA